MASGKLPSSSLGILSSAQMKDLITELKQRYDFVFFDSPPIMGVSDASILASEVDMTLQVIQYRRYPQPMNIRAKQLIEKVGGNLIGIVLNNINMSQDESYYYYSGYYHDYYWRKNERRAGRAAATAPRATSRRLGHQTRRPETALRVSCPLAWELNHGADEITSARLSWPQPVCRPQFWVSGVPQLRSRKPSGV